MQQGMVSREAAMLRRSRLPTQCGRLFEAYARGQRIGVAMHERPTVVVLAEDQRDAQRPVLRGKAADFDVRPFDGGEHYHVRRAMDPDGSSDEARPLRKKPAIEAHRSSV